MLQVLQTDLALAIGGVNIVICSALKKVLSCLPCVNVASRSIVNASVPGGHNLRAGHLVAGS